MESTTFKTCKKCGQKLPVTDFYKSKATSDGLQSYCKKCGCKSSVESNRRRRGLTATPASVPIVTNPDIIEEVVTKEVLKPDVVIPSNVKKEVESLKDFHSNALILELRKRGYKGDMYIIEQIKREVKL